jgi:branched-chain amino acid transport system permease protein
VFVTFSAAMAVLVASPYGFTLRAIRENEPCMNSLGFNTWLHCYISYVIAGAFAGVAGVMWAFYNGFVGPTYLDLTSSSEVFLMVTLGGPGTLVGPALGAGAIVLLKNVMRACTHCWLLLLGAAYIVSIPAAPQGLRNRFLYRSNP